MATLDSPEFDDWSNGGAVLSNPSGQQMLPMTPPIVSPENFTDYNLPTGYATA